MSLVPYIVNELLSELDRPSYDNHFFQPYERLTVAPLRAGYLRPWRHHHQNNSGVSSVANDKDGFKISLDVQQFKPEELNVKVSFIFVMNKRILSVFKVSIFSYSSHFNLKSILVFFMHFFYFSVNISSCISSNINN